MKVEQENVGDPWVVTIGNELLVLACVATVSAPLLTASRAWNRGEFNAAREAMQRAIKAHNTHLKTVRN